MSQPGAKLRCQRIGCDATFTDDDNPEDSCRYHHSVILRGWECSLSSSSPGRCKTGKHTTEKPVLAKVAPKTGSAPPARVPISALASNPSSKEACPRCKQGFFCSDHGSAAIKVKDEPADTAATATICPPKKIVGINEPQVCKNKGCGQTFKERDNHDTACNFHPGPAIFHDRKRGWKCCDVHVEEFDEFMGIPPCSKGWHNADPTS